jgi:hypothetical protein
MRQRLDDSHSLHNPQQAQQATEQHTTSLCLIVASNIMMKQLILLLLVSCCCTNLLATSPCCSAFQTSPPPSLLQHHKRGNGVKLSPSALFASDSNNNNNNDNDNNNDALLQRFLSPKIDDPGLPLTDVLLSQIVAPTLQLYWIFVVHAPLPSWARPISSYFGEAAELAPRGSLLAPTLIHGAGLAVCWLAGALAAKSFERDAFTLSSVDNNNNNEDYDEYNDGGKLSIGDTIRQYDTVLIRLFQAGAFAVGILIVSTQIDLLLEFQRYIQFGESEETDFRLLLASVEVINDIFFEALVLVSWRCIHANFMSTPNNRMRRF